MSTRKIKNAKDLTTNELIYFKGHAKATYMSDGTTVEDAINNIEAGAEVDLSDYATKEELSSKQDTITDLEVIRQGAAKGATALQSYTEQYKGTVTGVKVNGTTKNPSSGVVDLGTVITSHQDISGKQDKLVSGTNIKTINGTSILGSGDIVISSSGGSSNGNGAYAEVNHGTSDTTFTLTPNTFHVWDEVSSLDLSFGEETTGVANEFLFQFTSGSEPTTLILPDSIKFNSDFTVEANKIYQISILNGLGTVMSWEFTPSMFPVTLEVGDNGDIGISLYSYLQSTYGEAKTGTILNEEITNNYNGVVFGIIEYGTYMGLTGYWLDGFKPQAISWVLLENGYLQGVLPPELPGGTD